MGGSFHLYLNLRVRNSHISSSLTLTLRKAKIKFALLTPAFSISKVRAYIRDLGICKSSACLKNQLKLCPSFHILGMSSLEFTSFFISIFPFIISPNKVIVLCLYKDFHGKISIVYLLPKQINYMLIVNLQGLIFTGKVYISQINL